MLKIQDQRPPALLAVCAPNAVRTWHEVSGLPSYAAAPVALVRVGYEAATPAAATGATLTQPQRARRQGLTNQGIRASKISLTVVFAAKQSVKGMDPVGGLRGIPPRGWPV